MASSAQQQAFIAGYTPDAQVAGAQTGVPWQTILAQWADETAFGTSPAFLDGNNFAGISPGGSIADYPSQAAGLAAYIATLNSPTYATVRNAAAQGPIAAAAALGQSPWAGGHYDANNTGTPGTDLVDIMDQTGLAAGGTAQLASWTSWLKNNLGIWNAPNPFGSGTIGGAAAGGASDLATTIADSVVSDLINAAKKPALMAVALVGAGALILAGIYQALKPAADQASQTATKAAGDVATAGEVAAL